MNKPFEIDRARGVDQDGHRAEMSGRIGAPLPSLASPSLPTVARMTASAEILTIPEPDRITTMRHLMISVGARFGSVLLEAVDTEWIARQGQHSKAALWMLPAGQVVPVTDIDIGALVILLSSMYCTAPSA